MRLTFLNKQLEIETVMMDIPGKAQYSPSKKVQIRRQQILKMVKLPIISNHAATNYLFQVVYWCIAMYFKDWEWSSGSAQKLEQ